ncbi:MAG TPA: response regulator [Labilithrix sp.]
MTTILILDDDVRCLRATSRALAARGEYVIDATTSPREALEWIRSGRRFDVILCDLMLGETSGRDVEDAIRACSPMQASRVIFVSGYDPCEDEGLEPRRCLPKTLPIELLRLHVDLAARAA